MCGPLRLSSGSIMFSRSIHAVVCVSTSSVLWLNNIPTTHFVSFFTTWWIFELFPLFGYHKYCCDEYSYTSFYVNISFSFLGSLPKNQIASSNGICLFNFLSITRSFSKWLSQFTFLPEVYEALISSYLWQHLLLSGIFVIAILMSVKWCSLSFGFAFPCWLMALNIISNAKLYTFSG